MAIVLAKCPHCGSTLQVESSAENARCSCCSNTFAVGAAIQNHQMSQQNAAATPAKKNSTGTIIAFSIFMAIVLIAVIFLIVTVMNNSASPSRDRDRESGDNITNNDITNNDITNNNNTNNDNTNSVDPNALTGTYISESGLYEIKFKNDLTCIWYQDINGYEVFFNGTYEYEDGLYILHVEGGSYAYSSRFEAEPTADGLIITGGVVSGELFVKQ